MGDGIDDDDDRDEDRRAILARRNRFIALALSGLASTAGAGCYQTNGRGDDAGAAIDSGEPVPCLSPPLPEDAGAPAPCLGAPIDAGPAPCLGPPVDAGPAPCLDMPVHDAGEAMPVPCLTRPAE